MTFPDLNLALVVASIAAAALIGLSKGGLQMTSMFAVPVLSLALPPLHAAATLLPVLIASDVVGIIAYRRRFDRGQLAILLPAALVGVVLGWITAAWVSGAAVMMLIGLIGIGYCLKDWLWRAGDVPPGSAMLGRFWGCVSGFSSFISHSGGAPYQIYMLPQRLEKIAYAGTTTILFAAVNVAKLVPYWALGQLRGDTFILSVLLLPIAIVSAMGGIWLTRVMPETIFYRILDMALFVVSLKLVYDGLIESVLPHFA